MTTIYFIRHGETQSNHDRIRQGIKIDDYLDRQGELQVEQVIPYLKKLNLDILVTSYLHRAEQSAELIDEGLEKPVPIVHDSRLRERDFGSLTGKTQDQWDNILPNNRWLEKIQAYDYRPFGGESIDDVRQRSVSAVLDLIANYPDKNIGIIAHNGVIRLFLFHFPEIPRIYRGLQTDKDIANCDIYEWEVTPGRIANLQSLLK